MDKPTFSSFIGGVKPRGSQLADDGGYMAEFGKSVPFLRSAVALGIYLLGERRVDLMAEFEKSVPFLRSAVALGIYLLGERCVDLLLPARVPAASSDRLLRPLPTAADARREQCYKEADEFIKQLRQDLLDQETPE